MAGVPGVMSIAFWELNVKKEETELVGSESLKEIKVID